MTIFEACWRLSFTSIVAGITVFLAHAQQSEVVMTITRRAMILCVTGSGLGWLRATSGLAQGPQA
jgi:hypothetical protein